MTASRADSYSASGINQLERSDQTILANDAAGPGVLRAFRDGLFEQFCVLNRATDPQP
jgi:hypothetical protein